MNRYYTSILIASAIFALAHDVWAEPVKTVRIFDERVTTTDDPYSISARFVVNDRNKELGRAWIEANITGGYIDADLDREKIILKKNVAGLTFDMATNKVVYQTSEMSQPIVCGNFLKGGFFEWSSVEPTSSCRFDIKIEKRNYDDGYYVREKPYFAIDLVLTK